MREPVYRVSSSSTLFFSIFLPTCWIVFFGSFMLLILIMGGELSHIFSSLLSKIVLALCYLLFLAFLYFTLMRLRRVELTPDHFFVTNFFNTFRYSYESLQGIAEMDLLLMRLQVFRFHEKTRFGKKVVFIRRSRVWNEFNRLYPGRLPVPDQEN